MQGGTDTGAAKETEDRQPACCMVQFAVDLTISGPCAYVDLRDLQQGGIIFHSVIMDKMLMNFYYDYPTEGIAMLTEYARNMAISYLVMHQVHFRLQAHTENLVVRITELKDNRHRFVRLV
jgi:hypothetical protein